MKAGAQKWVIQRVKKMRSGAAGGESGVDADVVDGHENHDGAADEIDGRDAGCGRRCDGSGRGRGHEILR